MKLTVAFVIIVSLASSCRTHEPTRIKFNQPSQSHGIDWGSLEDSKIDSFKILNTGSVKVPLDGMLNTKKLPSHHGLEEYLWVDVFAFLFHHRDNGWFLIDTGLDSTFQESGNIRGLLAGNYIKESRQQPGQNIASQLRRENKKIAGIFLTHLHGDHTAGLPEIDNTIPKYIGQGEEHIHYPLLYHSNHLSASDTLIEMDWSASQPGGPFDKLLDIFGDQSLFAVSTPGHSTGHTSYVINSVSGLILLTGDASHTKYGFQNGIEPGWVDDEQKAINSLDQLIRFKELYPNTRIIYGHQE